MGVDIRQTEILNSTNMERNYAILDISRNMYYTGLTKGNKVKYKEEKESAMVFESEYLAEEEVELINELDTYSTKLEVIEI